MFVCLFVCLIVRFCSAAFRPLVSDRYDSPKPASSAIFSPARETGTPFNDEPLSNARRRAERVITEDSFFDSRGARVPKNTIGEAIREFDDEVCVVHTHAPDMHHLYYLLFVIFIFIFAFTCQRNEKKIVFWFSYKYTKGEQKI